MHQAIALSICAQTEARKIKRFDMEKLNNLAILFYRGTSSRLGKPKQLLKITVISFKNSS